MRKLFTLRGDKRFWAPIALTSGLAILFFGISFYFANESFRWVARLDIGMGIALLLLGFILSPLRTTTSTATQAPTSTQTTTPLTNVSKNMHNMYLKERNFLAKAAQDQSRSFDKYILTLSGGTFGLSVFIIKQLAPQPINTSMPLLIGAWFAFGASILITLISFLLSQKACTRNIELMENYLSGKADSVEYERINTYTRLTQIANWLSMSSFITGVVLLGRFGIMNMPTTGG